MLRGSDNLCDVIVCGMSSVCKYIQRLLDTHQMGARVPSLTKVSDFFKVMSAKINKIPPPPKIITSPVLGIIPSEYYRQIHPDIRRLIDNSAGYYSKQYVFELLAKPVTQNITVDFIYPFSEETGETTPVPAKMDKLFMKYLHRIYEWLYIANEYRTPECSDELHIWLYLTHAPKLLPTVRGESLGSKHANTAFTYPCNKSSSIFIFREEEWFKVLIHETFHCYGLDFCVSAELSEIALADIRKLFPRVKHTAVGVYETYSEIMAETMNIMFYRHHYRDGTHLKTLIQYERQFSLFQMVKVLRHMGLSYTDLFVEGEYQEDTNIFAYYVLKSICMFYLTDFLDGRMKESSLLRIGQNRGSVHDFTGFIRDKACREGFMREVGRMEKWFEEHPVGVKMEDLTMRMTVLC